MTCLVNGLSLNQRLWSLMLELKLHCKARILFRLRLQHLIKTRLHLRMGGVGYEIVGVFLKF